MGVLVFVVARAKTKTALKSGSSIDHKSKWKNFGWVTSSILQQSYGHVYKLISRSFELLSRPSVMQWGSGEPPTPLSIDGGESRIDSGWKVTLIGLGMDPGLEKPGDGGPVPLGPHKSPNSWWDRRDQKNTKVNTFDWRSTFFLFPELYWWSWNILYPGSWSPTDPIQPVGHHWVFRRQLSMRTFCGCMDPQCVWGPSVTMWALSEYTSPQ